MTDSQPRPEWSPCPDEWETRVLSAIHRASPRVRVRAMRARRVIGLTHPGFGLSRATLEREAARAAAYLAEMETDHREALHRAGRA